MIRAQAERFTTLPLFKPEEAPTRRTVLEGYSAGDAVWVMPDGATRLPARVLAALPKYHHLVLRLENPPRIAQVNPTTDPHHISRREARP